MLKRQITFKNLDGELTTRDFYFNLSVPEVTEMEFEMKGGMSDHWMKIIENKDAGGMLKAYRDLITKSYGEKSDDGITFLKFDPITGRPLGEKFTQSDAYSTLFMELLGPASSNDSFTDFLRSVVPPELLEKMPENVQLPGVGEAQNKPAEGVERTVEQHSREELLALSQEEFDKLAGTNPQQMSPEVLQVAFQRKSQAR